MLQSQTFMCAQRFTFLCRIKIATRRILQDITTVTLMSYQSPQPLLAYGVYNALLRQHQTWYKCCPDVVPWFADGKKGGRWVVVVVIGYKMRRKNNNCESETKIPSLMLCSICIYSATVTSVVIKLMLL